MSMPVIIPSTTTRYQSVTDVIESVALEQTALSHIINAEGMKLERVVATKELTIDQILATNKSVQSMLSAITRLEMVLQGKLELFDGCLCDEKDDSPIINATVSI